MTDKEVYITKSHALFTINVLEKLKGIEEIVKYAAGHHERLNGTGYPLGLKNDQISIGARIMAIADIFTAITEDRPYRDGMDKDKSMRVLMIGAKEGEIDHIIVKILIDNYDFINQRRIEAQNLAREEFEEFRKIVEFAA
ncbi:Cyclic di-GMP phosphodiesterase response regulator RpfG [compost metagenome]